MATKECFDSKKRTVEKSVEIGETVLFKQTKSTTKPQFYPASYTVIEVSSNNATLQKW